MPIEEIRVLRKGSVIKTLLEHVSVLKLHATVKTREELLQAFPWMDQLYASFYSWVERNKPLFLELPADGNAKKFQIAPTFCQPVLPFVKQEKKQKPTQKKLTKQQKQAKELQEQEELTSLLKFLGESTSSSSGKKKSKKKKSKAAEAEPSIVELKESPHLSAAAEGGLEDYEEVKPFAHHCHLPLLYTQRVSDWFKNPERALHRQGYLEQGSFRNRLLDQYGQEIVVANHKFPRVIDAPLLNSPNIAVVQQADGTFKVALPGYRKVMVEGEEKKEFGIFEIAYFLDSKEHRHVYHRFFRPVESASDLVCQFNLSQDKAHSIIAPEGLSVTGGDNSWTTTAEQEGWLYNEDTPGLIQVVHPEHEVSYILIKVEEDI